MANLTTFQKTDLVDDHLAADYNRLLPGALRAEFVNTASVAATLTLADNDLQYQVITPTGSNQDVKLPALTTASHAFSIYNGGSSNCLLIKDSTGATLFAVIGPDGWVFCIPSVGKQWRIVVDPRNGGCFLNLVINGHMRVAQRGTSVAGLTTSGYATVDRFYYLLGSLGTWTMSQDTDAPTDPGFRNSLKMLVTTNDAAPAAADYALIRYHSEGQMVQQIGKGTSSAKQLILTFWVKSNVTGAYVVELEDNDNTRHVCATYTISASATWEIKAVCFPADTSGVFDNDNADSLHLNFWMAAGSNYTSGILASAWASKTAANRAVGQVNVGAANNNYLMVTGINLMVGNVFTNFDFLPWDFILARCERYFFKTFSYATAPAQNAGIVGGFRFIAGKAGALSEYGSFAFPVEMRAIPTVTCYNPSAANAQARDESGSVDCSATTAGGNINQSICSVFATGNAATTVGNVLNVQLAADAELTSTI